MSLPPPFHSFFFSSAKEEQQICLILLYLMAVFNKLMFLLESNWDYHKGAN